MNKILKETASLIKKQKLIERKLNSINIQSLKGLSVKMSPEHRKWYKHNLENLFNTDKTGSNLKGDEKKSFDARKILIKKPVVGVIETARYDNEDGVTLSVKFDFPELGNYSEKILVGLENIKEV